MIVKVDETKFKRKLELLRDKKHDSVWGLYVFDVLEAFENSKVQPKKPKK